MGYTIDDEKIILKKHVESACDFDQSMFRVTLQNICDILNQRKIIARRIVNNGLTEGDGPEYETLIAAFVDCNTKLKLLLGL